MPAHKQNLWPFSSRKTAQKPKSARSSMTVGQAMERAFKAGQASGDTGLFEQWLESSGLSGRGNVLQKRLKKEYERGFETKFNEPPKRSVAPARMATASTEYRGRKIEAHEDGAFSVPSLDRDSRFDTVADAKKFIDSWKQTNPHGSWFAEAAQLRPVKGRPRQEYLLQLAEVIRRAIPDATVNGAKETHSVYVFAPSWKQELRLSDHTKFGRNVPTDIIPKTYEKLPDQIDRAVRAAISGAKGYAQVPTWTQLGTSANPTDRALRYRANQTPPAGPKQCAFCGSRDTIEIGHIDGHEEHGEPENLIWTCRSCNVIAANTMRENGLGRRTHQMNPTKKGGAANIGEWVNAVGAIVPHKGARYAGKNYGLASTMSTSDAVAMIRATPAHKRSEFAGKIRKTKAGRVSERSNPKSDADALNESFHGRPASETILVEETVHEHEHLAALGTLTELVVETVTGLLVTITFDETDTPFLASSEDGRQLYIEGGDQSLDLKSLKMDGDEWIKDRMVIGMFARPEPRDKGRDRRKHNITYRTKKEFDQFEEIDYQHDLGEETGVRPILVYAPRDQHLYIEGGQYRIEQPLIGTSPGIEN